ncbi:proline-rich nuclear receptor coactivator 1 [Protopterus annectens]|uniref:proline-rich nuclear receptor coactivator 1 n=1 Tax=Protopterus annectens TaxID=7888 RepID=UPI001CF9D74E|nr:proline-rich nuclear receptor coactivator 1 [Protopterus annectens]
MVTFTPPVYRAPEDWDSIPPHSSPPFLGSTQLVKVERNSKTTNALDSSVRLLGAATDTKKSSRRLRSNRYRQHFHHPHPLRPSPLGRNSNHYNNNNIGGRLAQAESSSNKGNEEASVYQKHCRKEVLKSKTMKSEKHPHGQPVHNLHKLEHPSNGSRQRNRHSMQLTKGPCLLRSETSHHQHVSSEVHTKDVKKPLDNANDSFAYVKKSSILPSVNSKEGDSYAGAKFSDPPSPSVLPKPPSHWVGLTGQHSDRRRELIAVHLKTLLKVQG